MVRNGLKRPKKAKKCQICKSPATPVAVPPYWKSERKYYFEVGPIAKKAIFGPKVPQKSRFAVRLVMNWQSDCRFWKLWFFCIEKWPWFLVSGPKSKNGIFWQKKWLLSLLTVFCHLAQSFYGLKLRDLCQGFRICQNISISLVPTRLYWPRLEILGKIRKQCYQTLFLGLMAFNTQNKCKLHSDQVSRHFISKKCDFDPFFDFSWSHPEMGIFFWKNQKVAFFSQKTGSDDFPVAN